MVSFVQSIGCTAFKKIIKSKFSKTTVADDLNTIFEALIAAGDASATASEYLTARRDAEKTLFGITVVTA
jgi:GH24 family phage-related lysozyme (muramidase)